MNQETENWVKTICKIGQKAACCRYLTMGGEGWSCAKPTALKTVLDDRVRDGRMNARGDNCEGKTLDV